MANRKSELDKYVIQYEAVDTDPVRNIIKRIKKGRLRPEDIKLPR